MKKILLTVISSLAIMSFAGCAANPGSQLVNITTENAPKADSVKSTDYENNLSGLEKYFTKLEYLPSDTEPTEMMYSVIGAVDGDRYTFQLNSSGVVVELYEYNPDKLNDDAKRVLSEVKKDGKFNVFKSNGDSDMNAYEATLSDNEKYLMIYTDNSENKDNVARKKEVVNALKKFDGGAKTTSSETSKN